MDHDDVGDFELAGLFPLQLVAGLWLHEDDDDIGDLADGGVSLAGADGLDNDGLESEAAEQTDHEINVGRNARMTAGRGQASDEHASSSGRLGMRMRSPSKAPPVSGLCGSHASTATERPDCRITSMSLPISVLFPTPPLPVMAMTRVLRRSDRRPRDSARRRRGRSLNLPAAPPA